MSRPMTEKTGQTSPPKCRSGAPSRLSILRRTTRPRLTSQLIVTGWMISSPTFSKRQIWERAGAQSPMESQRAHTSTACERIRIDKRQPAGDNAPMGAMIDYYFKSAPKDEVTLDIIDAQGKLVRHLSSKEKKENEQPPEWPDRVEAPKTIPANEGMNRFAWDLRYNEPIQIPGAFYSTNGPRGSLALPGDYQMKLTANGKTQTATLHLV